MPLPPFAPGPTTTAVTQSAGDSSTKIANTQFVTTAVNNAIAGVNPAVAVQYATTVAGDSSGLTYSNGVSGVGATMTGANNTATTIDGHTFVVGDVGVTRLLIKNDTQSPSGAFNGVYLFTALHTSITGDIFTRAVDYDTPTDMNNTGAIPVVSGTANASTTWVLTSNITTVGTSPLTYAQFSLNPATIMTTPTYDAAAIAQQVVGTTATQTVTNKTLTSVPNLIYSNNAVNVSSNAATVPVTSRLTTVTNNAAGSVTITITTTSAVDGQLLIVRYYDHTAATQTLSWVNTENSTVSVPTTSNGSTTLPTTVGFMYNSQTSKWRCIASA